VELSILNAIILGIIQGATEFLPVSSSGHLVLAQDILGISLEGNSLIAFDVCLHFGTLMAVIYVFWKDIVVLLRVCVPKYRVQNECAEQLTLIKAVLIGTLPAIAMVICCKSLIDSMLHDAFFAALFLFVTGLILWVTRFAPKNGTQVVGVKRAIAIGCAQAIAILPGISRSGSTIATGLFLGVSKKNAATYSFLLSIPAIGGAMLLHLNDLVHISVSNLIAIGIGTIVAAMTGVVCIKWLLWIVNKGKLSLFSYYCMGMSIVFLIIRYAF